MIRPELLSILRCPKCKGMLREGPAQLTCTTCKLVFSVEDGIPNMLIEDARPLAASEAQ